MAEFPRIDPGVGFGNLDVTQRFVPVHVKMPLYGLRGPVIEGPRLAGSRLRKGSILGKARIGGLFRKRAV